MIIWNQVQGLFVLVRCFVEQSGKTNNFELRYHSPRLQQISKLKQTTIE